MSCFAVAALYRFVRVPDPAAVRTVLREKMQNADLCGSLLLAPEGINGTISGRQHLLRSFIAWLSDRDTFDGRFAELDVKWSTADAKPFRRAKVRLKKEIVTLGLPDVSPIDPDSTGTYLSPEQWNQLLSDPDVVLVDTRNDYEVQLGTFHSDKGPAMDPQTATFREFPGFVAERLADKKDQKIAMFCTGGIRCEKSTALLKQLGFRDVYHLRGGILRYLEEVPEGESRFAGDCFVFDRRVAVGHGLRETDHELCFACGWPTSAAEREQESYQPGVSCPRCAGRHTEQQIARFRMRQQQLAASP